MKEHQTELLFAFQVDNGAIQKMNPKDQTEEFCIDSVRKNPDNLKYVKDQTRTVCYEAIKKKPDTLQYVWNQTDDICLLAVMTDGLTLRYVLNQTDEICLAAVKQNPEAIMFVWKQTYAIKDACLRRNGMMLRYITFPTDYFIELAVKQNPDAIVFVEDPSDTLVDYALEKNPRLIDVVEQTDDRRDKVLELCPSCIAYIHEPSTTECIRAVSDSGLNIVNVPLKYRTKSVYFYAVKVDPGAIDYAIRDHVDSDIMITCGVEACEIGGLKYIWRIKGENRWYVFKQVMRNKWNNLIRRISNYIDNKLNNYFNK